MLYIIVLTIVLFSFCFPNFVNSNVFCYESSIQFLVYMCLLKYISSTLKKSIKTHEETSDQIIIRGIFGIQYFCFNT